MKQAFLFAALFVAVSLAGAALATTPADCPPPTDAESTAENLPHLATALKPGGTVDILAIGTIAATPGLPPGAASTGFLPLLGQDLQAAEPGLHLSITPRGGRGQDAAAQLDIIRAALKQHHYTAVLWQTGTLEAVRSEPADVFYETLSDGADVISQAGADVILVEPQYSRFLEANADLSPYLSALQAMDAAPATLLFHRYALMREWADAGDIDLENADAAHRPAIAAHLHACLAAELARAILAGAHAAALR